MPAFSTNGIFFSSLLLTLAVLLNSPTAHSEDKAPWVGETLDKKKCQGSKIGFGPHDYLRRKVLTAELEVVENAHFTSNIERLESGNSSTAINDIGYTIMAWPNHHRALHSAMRYRIMFWEWPDDAKVPPAECQLQRAIEFSPQDPVPYMMYGLLLHKAKQYDKALLSYRAAHRLRPDDVLTQYNMGLTLVELKQYEEAVKMAKSAYAAGMPLPGLKNKLIEAGQWEKKPGGAAPEKVIPQVKLKTQDQTVEDKSTNSVAAKKQPAKAQDVKQQPPKQAKTPTTPKDQPTTAQPDEQKKDKAIQ